MRLLEEVKMIEEMSKREKWIGKMKTEANFTQQHNRSIYRGTHHPWKKNSIQNVKLHPFDTSRNVEIGHIFENDLALMLKCMMINWAAYDSKSNSSIIVPSK